MIFTCKINLCTSTEVSESISLGEFTVLLFQKSFPIVTASGHDAPRGQSIAQTDASLLLVDKQIDAKVLRFACMTRRRRLHDNERRGG